MSASNPNSAVLDYDTGCAQHLCLLDARHDPRLFAYPSKAMPGKHQVSSFLAWHRQQTVERIATKEPDVYCQLSSRWQTP
ncbi:hypothetical protein [Candidatus Nitrotoga sp. 1052]|uniref:hypothetical protein n=1 Tax=Candidatus Nitrotoga sp. 1052 TaxID=2886964 RepID=UPI001EF6FB4A|nr:hypothetical protein [Candidatus Nitrotoga sp. 1052]